MFFKRTRTALFQKPGLSTSNVMASCMLVRAPIEFRQSKFGSYDLPRQTVACTVHHSDSPRSFATFVPTTPLYGVQ